MLADADADLDKFASRSASYILYAIDPPLLCKFDFLKILCDMETTNTIGLQVGNSINW